MVTLFDCYSTTNDANTGVKEHYKFIPTEIVCSSIFANGREDETLNLQCVIITNQLICLLIDGNFNGPEVSILGVERI